MGKYQGKAVFYSIGSQLVYKKNNSELNTCGRSFYGPWISWTRSLYSVLHKASLVLHKAFTTLIKYMLVSGCRLRGTQLLRTHSTRVPCTYIYISPEVFMIEISQPCTELEHLKESFYFIVEMFKLIYMKTSYSFLFLGPEVRIGIRSQYKHRYNGCAQVYFALSWNIQRKSLYYLAGVDFSKTRMCYTLETKNSRVGT